MLKKTKMYSKTLFSSYGIAVSSSQIISCAPITIGCAQTFSFDF